VFQAWKEISVEYNASQVSGTKTVEQLKKKYTNFKSAVKRTLSNNAKEIKKTGGGPALLADTDDFGFASEQINGLTNRFDSDFHATTSQNSNQSTLEQEKEQKQSDDNSDKDEEDLEIKNSVIAASVGHPLKTPTSSYKGKKKTMKILKDTMLDLKEEGLKLDRKVETGNRGVGFENCKNVNRNDLFSVNFYDGK
jgi:hypothetical protein